MIESHRPITSTMFLRLYGNGFSEFQLYQKRKIPALPPQEFFNPLAISDQSWQDSRYLRDPELLVLCENQPREGKDNEGECVN